MQEQEYEKIVFEQETPFNYKIPKRLRQPKPQHSKLKKLPDSKLNKLIQHASLKARDIADKSLARAIHKKAQQFAIRLVQQKQARLQQVKITEPKTQASLIIVLQIQRNQVQQLERFMNYLSWMLLQGQSNVVTSQEVERFILFQFKNTNQVREIILKMHTRLDHVKNDKKCIFLPHKVTDLNENNLYLFKKGLAGETYKLVIATFDDLQNEAVDRQSTLGLQIDIFYLKLFDAKTLFVEFMSNCLFHSEIKAYLPKQCVDLITDYDYYPLSYHCGVHRLIFLIKQNMLLHGGEMQFVDINTHIKPIKEALHNLCPAVYKNDLQTLRQKIITTILTTGERSDIPEKVPGEVLQNKVQSRMRKEHINDKYRFTIPPLFEEHYQRFFQKQSNRNPQFFVELITQIANQYKKEKEKQQQLYDQEQQGDEFDFQWCINQLIPQEAPPPKVSNSNSKRTRRTNKPKDDYERYQIDKQQIRAQGYQAVAQKKITTIIRKASQGVIEHTKKFKWQDFEFEWRIRPQLPRQIVANALSYASKSRNYRMKTMHQLLNLAIHSYQIDIKKFVQQYNYKQKNEGELMSIVKDLEILGILERGPKLSQLIFNNNFYQKSVYRART